MYVPTYVDLAHGLWQQEAHAHGPIILGVAAWLVWRQRAALASAEAGKSALLAGWADARFRADALRRRRSQGIAVFEVAPTCRFSPASSCCYGWRALRGCGSAFLPRVPGAAARFMIDIATAPLKNFVSHIVESMLYELGYRLPAPE